MTYKPGQKRGAAGTSLGGQFVGPKSIARALIKALSERGHGAAAKDLRQNPPHLSAPKKRAITRWSPSERELKGHSRASHDAAQLRDRITTLDEDLRAPQFDGGRMSHPAERRKAELTRAELQRQLAELEPRVAAGDERRRQHPDVYGDTPTPGDVPDSSTGPDLTGAAGLSHDPAVRQVQIENRVRAAVMALKARPFTPESNVDLRNSGWVRMADLRAELGADIPREDVDAALKRLSIHGGNAIPESAQWLLRPEDRAAALSLGGQAKHWMRIDDPSPRPLPSAQPHPSPASVGHQDSRAPGSTGPVPVVPGAAAKAAGGHSALDAAPVSLLSNLERHRDAKAPTPAESAAFDAYGSDGQAINARLRRGGRITAPIAQMDVAMARSPLSSDVELWRGVSGGSDLPGLDLSGDVTGATFTDRAFVSTSVDRQVAERFAQLPGAGPKVVLRVHAPQGTGGVAFSSAGGISESQGEMLLARGLTFRVAADHGTVDGFRHLDVEVVPVKALDKAPRKAAAKVASAKASAEPPHAIAARLHASTDENEARAMLSGLTVKQLNEVAAAAGLERQSGRKAEIVDRISYQTVGHRVDSAVLRTRGGSTSAAPLVGPSPLPAPAKSAAAKVRAAKAANPDVRPDPMAEHMAVQRAAYEIKPFGEPEMPPAVAPKRQAAAARVPDVPGMPTAPPTPGKAAARVKAVKAKAAASPPTETVAKLKALGDRAGQVRHPERKPYEQAARDALAGHSAAELKALVEHLNKYRGGHSKLMVTGTRAELIDRIIARGYTNQVRLGPPMRGPGTAAGTGN